MATSPNDRLPPQSREAEKGVLGALFREGIRADGAFGLLEAADFYFDAHQKIYCVFADHAAAGKPFDLVSCCETLRERKHLEDVGGPAYLAELWDAVPTGANLEHHAGIVKDRSDRRRLIHLATEMIRDGYEINGSAADLLDAFAESVYSVGAAKSAAEPVPLDRAIDKVLEGIDARGKPGGARPIPTGFDSLNMVLGGFRPGELVYVGARPSVGKSALATSFLLACAGAGKSALMFSLEMDCEELAARILSMKSSVNLNLIRGAIDHESIRVLLKTADETKLPIWIDDRASHTVDSIASVSRRAVRKHGVGMVVIDYLQLIAPQNSREPRHEQVGAISRKLKLLSRTLGVPVLCLCQLNRQCEDRSDGRPLLSDLRESGNLEQDADVVLLLWPQDMESQDPTQRIRVCVEKQRNGPRKVVQLEYRRAFTRFEEPEPKL